MKESLVKIAAGVFVIGLGLTFFIQSVPPANLPLYIGLGCIALIPALRGSRSYRLFGILGIAILLVLSVLEHQAGVRHKQYLKNLREHIDSVRARTNPPSIK